jgi:hypothetical protein
MISSRSAFLFGVVSAFFVSYAHSVKMIVRPHAVECFTEHPGESHDLITGSFFVESLNGFNGKEASFDLTVTDPSSFQKSRDTINIEQCAMRVQPTVLKAG